MIIRTGTRTGPVEYKIEGEPRIVDGDDGRTHIEVTLRHARTGSTQQAYVMLGADEIDKLAEARRKLRRR